MEIGLVDDALIDTLLTRATPGSTVRLGRTIISLPAPPHQVAASPWASLAERVGNRAWCLRFMTPLTFRRGNKFTPLPAPTPIVASLRAAWRTFAPATVAQPDLDLALDPVWVTDIDGANDVRTVNGRIVSGFVGRLRIECESDDHVARAVDQVIGLAPFSGVGAYTTRGFGVTRLEPTWHTNGRRTSHG